MKQRKIISVLFIALTISGFADDQAKEIEAHIEALQTATKGFRQENLDLQNVEGRRNPIWMRGRKAMVDLVMMGEKGWAAITGLTLNLDQEGDAARSMITLMPGPINVDEGFFAKLDGFKEYQRIKHRELATNETWALLYAQLNGRCMLDNQEEMIPSWYHAYKRRMTECSKEFVDVRDALIPLSYLRIHYSNNASFPGHAHPWNGSVNEQKSSLEKIREWCLLNLEEYPRELYRPN